MEKNYKEIIISKNSLTLWCCCGDDVIACTGEAVRPRRPQRPSQERHLVAKMVAAGPKWSIKDMGRAGGAKRTEAKAPDKVSKI